MSVRERRYWVKAYKAVEEKQRMDEVTPTRTTRIVNMN